MVDIRPNILPDAILPLRSGDALIVDQGADGVRKTDPVSITDSVAPVATQPEASTGTDNVKRMTPLRTKQSISSEVGVTIASNSQGVKADSAVQSVNGKTGNSITIDKSDVGLGNVDNTSDANKPISAATQDALNLKANDSEVVKSVNGVSPIAGNVTVAAEEKRLQDTRTTAIAESFANNVQFVETAGYSSVGDGGGALYKRVATEPSHIGKFQSADGAWWEECPQHSALSFTNLLQDTSSLYAYGANNGWFLGYDLKGGMSFKVYQSENVMDTGGPGAFRDGFYVQHVDGDTTDYGTPQRRVISSGARVLANGKYTNTGGWEAQTKDIVALDAHAIGRITGWDDRGVSGVAAGAIQYGSGIASNEFAAENSVYADEQSTSMAAVQAILRPHKGAADATHKYRAVLASNTQGYEATAAFEAYSAAHPTEPARNGAFKIGLELAGVNATEAGIRMPRTGSNGGLIDYDANDYSRYDRTANRFDFVIGGNFVLSWTSFGVAIGGLASGDARLKIPQSTSAGPHLRLVPGGTPSAPQDGDIWFDGQLRVRIGGVTRTVTVT